MPISSPGPGWVTMQDLATSSSGGVSEIEDEIDNDEDIYESLPQPLKRRNESQLSIPKRQKLAPSISNGGPQVAQWPHPPIELVGQRDYPPSKESSSPSAISQQLSEAEHNVDFFSISVKTPKTRMDDAKFSVLKPINQKSIVLNKDRASNHISGKELPEIIEISDSSDDYPGPTSMEAPFRTRTLLKKRRETLSSFPVPSTLPKSKKFASIISQKSLPLEPVPKDFIAIDSEEKSFSTLLPAAVPSSSDGSLDPTTRGDRRNFTSITFPKSKPVTKSPGFKPPLPRRKPTSQASVTGALLQQRPIVTSHSPVRSAEFHKMLPQLPSCKSKRPLSLGMNSLRSALDPSPSLSCMDDISSASHMSLPRQCTDKPLPTSPALKSYFTSKDALISPKLDLESSKNNVIDLTLSESDVDTATPDELSDEASSNVQSIPFPSSASPKMQLLLMKEQISPPKQLLSWKRHKLPLHTSKRFASHDPGSSDSPGSKEDTSSTICEPLANIGLPYRLARKTAGRSALRVLPKITHQPPHSPSAEMFMTHCVVSNQLSPKSPLPGHSPSGSPSFRHIVPTPTSDLQRETQDWSCKPSRRATTDDSLESPQLLVCPTSVDLDDERQKLHGLVLDDDLEYANEPFLQTVTTESESEVIDVLLSPDDPPLPEVNPLLETGSRLAMSSHALGPELSSSSEACAFRVPLSSSFEATGFRFERSVTSIRAPGESLAFQPPVSAKNFGGIEGMSWETYRQDLRNFNLKCYYAKDLPHSLHDHINQWEKSLQCQWTLASVFQSAILENTADDEPETPIIEIINEVDNEPTPLWEFYYTNHLWHGEGVPPPDLSTLKGCNCRGRCDPKSKGCACIQRQRQYTGDVTSDFVYDSRGRLKTLEVFNYPIFECNDLCGCDEECRNRVVQHGRKVIVNIQKTREKGWGVFAGHRKIPAGSFIGIYSGELLTDSDGEMRGLKYNKFGRTYLFDLDFYFLHDGNENWQVKYTVDAYHAGNFTRFLNHSCDPNCQLVPSYINESNIEKPLLTVFARRDIEPFEEICFSYHGPIDDDEDSIDVSSNENESTETEAVYAPCACKAMNCKGKLFR